MYGLFLTAGILSILKNMYGIYGETFYFCNVWAIHQPRFVVLCGIYLHFFAIIILYPIVRRHYKLYTLYYAPIISVAIIGILIKNYGTICVIDNYMFGIICVGNLRAIAMLSIGLFINGINKEYLIHLNKKFNLRCILTITEVLGYIFVFGYMRNWDEQRAIFDGEAVFILAMAEGISLCELGILQNVVKGYLPLLLEKLSVALFLGHFYWTYNIENFAKKMNWSLDTFRIKLFGLVIAFFNSVLIMIIVKIIKDIKYVICKRKV